MNPYTPNFLQSKEWAETNKLIGHKVIWLGDLLTIVKSAKRGRYLEIPGAPQGVDFKQIKELAKKEHCVFVRIRFQLPNSAENRKWAAAQGLRPAPMHLHAEHTVILDLTQPEDQLLAKMRRQTRYEVRRSAKLGIQVTKSNSEAVFHEFYQVQQETAARQHFIAPDEQTLLAERRAFGDQASIYIAKTADDEVIAYGLILMVQPEAAYFEAASTPLGRNLPGAYALQWQVIRDLRAAGFPRYNLWGIAPPDQPHHRYAGVTTFKTGFGGEIVEYLPAQDLVINKLRYLPDLAIETLRKKRRHLG